MDSKVWDGERRSQEGYDGWGGEYGKGKVKERRRGERRLGNVTQNRISVSFSSVTFLLLLLLRSFHNP